MPKSPLVSAIAFVFVLWFPLITTQAGERPAMPEGVPDLTKVEVERQGGDWYLHCGGTRGWAWRDKANSCDRARPHIKDVIEHIRHATDKPKLISIAPYLESGR